MKLNPKDYYWVLLCKCGVKPNEYLVCGVYPSKKEAQEVDEKVAWCPAKHYIKRCRITINF